MSDNSVYNACDFCRTFFDFVWLDSPESSLDKDMRASCDSDWNLIDDCSFLFYVVLFSDLGS